MTAALSILVISLVAEFRSSILSTHANGNRIILDIKPNNILINYHENGEDEPIITAVQIGDIEGAVDISAAKGIVGIVCGNQLWRSPESWAKGLQAGPSDVFSFAIFVSRISR